MLSAFWRAPRSLAREELEQTDTFKSIDFYDEERTLVLEAKHAHMMIFLEVQKAKEY